MRATRWLAAILALLLLATGVAAWVLPGRMDAESFRGPLQRLAGRMLGVPVRIAGPIRLVLLPRPVLEAGGLVVEAAANAAAPTLTAEGVRLRLALRPLLAGQIQAQSLLLYRPDLRLPGRFDPRLLLLRHPGWIGTAATRIESGRIEVGDLVVSGIGGRIAAEPLTGDLVAGGQGLLPGDAPWGFSLRLTQPGGDGAAGLAVALTGLGPWHGTAFGFSGQLAAGGTLQGHATAHGPDLGRLLPTPRQPFSAEGRVSVADGLAEADDLTLRLGGAPARGAVALRLAPSLRLDLALAASRLDLDPWLALLRGGTAGNAAMPVGIDLSAEAGSLAGGVVRGLRAAFDLAPGQVTVRELRASLPGDAALRLTGIAGRNGFAGEASLAAPAWGQTQPWLAAWLPGGLPALPLAQLDLSAHVQADAGGVALSRLTGTLQGGRVAGSLAWRAASGQQPASLSAALALQRLRLEPFLAASLPGMDLDLGMAVQHAAWRGLEIAPLQVDMARRDGAWTLRRLQATAGGMDLTAGGRLAADGRLADGRLTLAARPLAAWRAIPDLPPLPLPADAPLLQAPLHVDLQGSGTAAALSVTVQGTLGDLSFEGAPVVDLRHGDWSGPVRLRDASARRLLEASRLLPQAGLPDSAAWLGDGSLAVSARCTGTPTSLAVEDLTMTAGSLRLGGRIVADRAGTPSVAGSIAAASLPLPPWAGLAQFWLSGGAPRGRASLALQADRVLAGGNTVLSAATADLSLADGRFRVQALRASLSGGRLQGDAALDLAEEPPRLRAQAAVDGADISGGLTGLPVDLLAGRLTAQASVTASGHSAAAILASLAGRVTAEVSSGALGGVALTTLPADLADSSVQAALAGGVTEFDHAALALRLDHGIATVEQGGASLPFGALAVTGSYDLAQDAADLALSFRPLVAPSPLRPDLAAPAIGLRLLGPRGRVQRIAELAPLARWRAARDQP